MNTLEEMMHRTGVSGRLASRFTDHIPAMRPVARAEKYI